MVESLCDRVVDFVQCGCCVNVVMQFVMCVICSASVVLFEFLGGKYRFAMFIDLFWRCICSISAYVVRFTFGGGVGMSAV